MTAKAIEVIHEDADILVINKPAGISVTGDRTGSDDILTVLAGQMRSDAKLRLVHRLDKYTSGVMVIARNQEAQSSLSSRFAKRTVKKTYLALVRGIAPRQRGTIRMPIARYRKDPRKMIPDPKRGKPAVTHYHVLADFGLYSLLKVQPETGRTHQIRTHLSFRKMPLAIDPLYGTESPVMLSDIKPGYLQKKGRPESALIDRLTLHAYQLEIPTESGDTCVYRAGLDRKFAATLKMLAKHNPKGLDAFVDPDDLERILAIAPI